MATTSATSTAVANTVSGGPPPSGAGPTGFANVQDQISYIITKARSLGLDPAAVLSVASHEGLGSGPGDNGTSFGPFQLHWGGAYPASAPQGDPAAAQAWANSAAGIDYALSGIARVTQGLQGPPAIQAQVLGFEKPTNTAAEISASQKDYGKWQFIVSSHGGSSFGEVLSSVWGTVSTAALSGPTAVYNVVSGAQTGQGGNVFSSAGAGGASVVESTSKFLGKLDNANFWIRVAEVVGGALLIGLALYLIAKDMGVPGKLSSIPGVGNSAEDAANRIQALEIENREKAANVRSHVIETRALESVNRRAISETRVETNQRIARERFLTARAKTGRARAEARTARAGTDEAKRRAERARGVTSGEIANLQMFQAGEDR